MKKTKALITINTIHLLWLIPALQIAFIILRVTDYVHWAWYWVLSPLLAVIFMVLLFIGVVAIVAHEEVKKGMQDERDDFENYYKH